MRHAGRMKGGFYPAPSAAVALAAGYLQPPPGDQRCAIFDPCAGEGEAIGQLADVLGCAPDLVHAIELEQHRGERCRQRLGDEAPILTPASFFGCRIRSQAFSLVWCNPPFDDEIGGGERVEGQFLSGVTYLLVPGGVLCLVCPERVWKDGQVRNVLLTHYDDISCVPFPDDCRNFGEVVVFAVRRKQFASLKERGWRDATCEPRVYTLPPSRGAGHLWEKRELTDEELIEGFARSPLRRFLEPPPARQLPSPPLALGKGHLALLLAAGQLDGLVSPPGEAPHVVRGVAKKVEEVTDVSEEEKKDDVVVKTTYTERIVLTVRAVGSDGEIRTFSQE